MIMRNISHLVLVRYQNNQYPGCVTRTSVPFAPTVPTDRPTKATKSKTHLQKAKPFYKKQAVLQKANKNKISKSFWAS